MHRKSETGGLTAFSKAGAAVTRSFLRESAGKDERSQQSLDAYVIDAPRSSAKDRETCESVATQWSWRSYREQRSRRGEYHTVMFPRTETPVRVSSAVAGYSRGKTDRMFSLRVD